MAIDRYQLVTRHNPKVAIIDRYAPLTIGNGEFAYTADITGFQTFPQEYEQGIPLCTQSQWGWHIQPANNEKGFYSDSDFKREVLGTGFRKAGYAINPQGQEDVYHWLRMNPHRLHLGKIALHIVNDDGRPAVASEIQNASQSLNLWTGLLHSSFSVGDKPVQTYTCCHPKKDMVAFRIESSMLRTGQMGIDIAFPYGSPVKTAADWDSDALHNTEILENGDHFITLKRVLDKNQYFVRIQFSAGASIQRTGNNSFTIRPAENSAQLEAACLFTTEQDDCGIPSWTNTAKDAEEYWEDYWNNGGIIELAGSSDERAMELERRIILSQYLLAVQCAGTLPPQETGLTFNSWYGKYHLEMHWWHGVHFPLWGRAELFEKSMWWYQSILPKAREKAQSQGYRGARWPKMVSYDGDDSPSPIGPLLIWQQPHPIYYAELLYKTHPNAETLHQYQEMVLETAEFMASYAQFDMDSGRYHLGPAVIPAQENHEPMDTLNPTFELEYWAFGLNTANEWRKRLGLEPKTEWERIAKELAPLPVKDGVYLAHENCPDTFARFNRDHPSMLGALGFLPGAKVDHQIMLKTLETVFEQWNMDEVWGWDFPLMAMTAARLGRPDLAVDALLCDAPKNEYLLNGHNKQADRTDLPIYLPGNGGLLTAIAMMTAGWEGCKEPLPGFPKDGTWNVAWEGLYPML